MKKLLALLLALVMIFGVTLALSSCGEDNKDDDQTEGEGGEGEGEGGGETTGKQYAWSAADNKQIKMKLSLNQTSFTNLSKRYITGTEQLSTAAKVDGLIAQRNQAVEDTTNVKVKYDYYEGAEAGWGDIHGAITRDANSDDPTSIPDVYIVAIYDCIWATFSDSLANIVSTKRDSGNNYFSFLESGYDSKVDDLGYNYDLMRSFSPIPDKAMFMVSSDYTIDVFRAIHAMPVSLTLLNEVSVSTLASKDPNGYTEGIDKNGDGKIHMTELYDFTMDGKWTWDVLASFCQAIYQKADGATGESFTAPKFGFYMDVYGGSSGRSIVYGSPFQHFTKTVDPDTGIPTYTQNTGENFMRLAEALTRVWKVDGAARVANSKSGIEAYGPGAIWCEDGTSLTVDKGGSLADVAIMEKFGNEQVLFMNNTLIGCIEYSYFRNMKGGFGILPMPVIDASTDGTPEYTTCIGNGARVAAINVITDDFAEATAYLDYQSTHSQDIIKAYFRSQQFEATNGEYYNVNMLTYLRTILVDQEANMMNIYCQSYLSNANSVNFTEADKIAYFGPETGWGNYDFSGTNNDAGSYKGIVNAFTRNDDSASLLRDNYTQYFINTINVMYKVIVDKFVDVADKL